MRILRLGLENLRIFSHVELEQLGRVNVIYGPNAAGKTTVLEAIHVLATTRSFRSPNILDLLRYEASALRITAKISGPAGGASIPLGLERNRQGLTLRAAGRRLQRTSELATWLPVQVIHPDSHQLVSGGPKHRRRFLDWGVFHVEPMFQESWRRYDRALRQRNAALKTRRSAQSEEAAWDLELSEGAIRLDSMRRQYLQELCEILPQFTGAIAGGGHYGLEYQPGWDTARPLHEELRATLERDRKRGFTCSGPHRAELLLTVNGHRAQQTVSRGQQKMLVTALILAQAELLARRTGKSSVLLLDDLLAELDAEHRRRVLAILRDMQVQVFMTTVDRGSVDLTGWDDIRLFHVEQGRLTEVGYNPAH
jgi:DNA replication and repair protein RecF